MMKFVKITVVAVVLGVAALVGLAWFGGYAD